MKKNCREKTLKPRQNPDNLEDPSKTFKGEIGSNQGKLNIERSNTLRRDRS